MDLQESDAWLSLFAVAVGDVGDKLIEKLTPRVQGLKVGPGTDPEVEMGPLISDVHLSKVKSYVDSGVAEGADLIVDGRSISLQGYENGYFIGGCLFDHVKEDMKIYREEIFGPVLSVVRQPTFDDALKWLTIMNSETAPLFILVMVTQLELLLINGKIGMVGVNVPIPVPMAFHSFGGWKRSLFGDHAMHGMDGVRFFTRLKTVTSRWPTGIRKGAEFTIPTMK